MIRNLFKKESLILEELPIYTLVSEVKLKKDSFPTPSDVSPLLIVLKQMVIERSGFLNKLTENQSSRVLFQSYHISIFPFRVFFSLEKNKKIEPEKIKQYSNDFFNKILEDSNKIISNITKSMQDFGKEDKKFLEKHKKEKVKNPKVIHFYRRTENFNDFYITLEIWIDKLKLSKNSIENICKKILPIVNEESKEIATDLIKND